MSQQATPGQAFVQGLCEIAAIQEAIAWVLDTEAERVERVAGGDDELSEVERLMLVMFVEEWGRTVFKRTHGGPESAGDEEVVEETLSRARQVAAENLSALTGTHEEHITEAAWRLAGKRKQATELHQLLSEAFPY